LYSSREDSYVERCDTMWFKFSGTEVVTTTQDWGYKFDVKVS
jgi:hypothetical protein